MTKAPPSKVEPPWDKKAPKPKAGQPPHHLTPPEKASAKRHAKAAGRPYPNLVDNMQAAGRAKK